MNDIGAIDAVDEGANDSVLTYYVSNDWADDKAEEHVHQSDSKYPQAFFNTTRAPLPDINELNRRKAGTFYPIFIILGCIMVLGILCNILVCYIYRCRSRRATSNFFVIFFAIYDIFGSLVGISLQICALSLPYVFNVEPVCKVIGFIETVSVCSLCLTLICVSYDCYRKHSSPAEYLGVKKARVHCIVAIVVSVIASIPAFFVFRTREIQTLEEGVYGLSCSIDIDLPHWLQIVYYSCVLSTFTFSLIVMTVLYFLIFVNHLKQRQAEERGEKPSPAKRAFPKKHRFVRADTSTSSMTNYSEEICRLHSQGSSSHSKSTDKTSPRAPLKGSSIVKSNSLQASSSPPPQAVVQLHVKHTRQTCMFVVVSVVFVVLMLPYVVVSILCVASNVFHQFSSSEAEIAFNFCIRSYLLNYLVKPVVYLVFNMNFRKEVRHLFIKLWAFCTRSNADQLQSDRQLRRSFNMGAPRSTSRLPIYRPPNNSS